jgi:hypothetical protein
MREYTCPTCGHAIKLPPMAYQIMATKNKSCQGCRAADTLSRVDYLTAQVILDFFARTGWPESCDAWTGEEGGYFESMVM